MEEIIYQCIGAFIGCFGFAFIFRLHHNIKFAFLGAINGLIAFVIYLLTHFMHNIYFQNFIAMFVASLIAEMLARTCRAPATIFITIGCFPLVPGRGIYQTMLYAISGESNLFLQSALQTIGIAGSLALAILFSSTIILIFKNSKNHPYLLFKDPFE